MMPSFGFCSSMSAARFRRDAFQDTKSMWMIQRACQKEPSGRKRSKTIVARHASAVATPCRILMAPFEYCARLSTADTASVQKSTQQSEDWKRSTEGLRDRRRWVQQVCIYMYTRKTKHPKHRKANVLSTLPICAAAQFFNKRSYSPHVRHDAYGAHWPMRSRARLPVRLGSTCVTSNINRFHRGGRAVACRAQSGHVRGSMEGQRRHVQPFAFPRAVCLVASIT